MKKISYIFIWVLSIMIFIFMAYWLYESLHRDDMPEVSSVHAYHCVKIYQFNDGTTKWYYHSRKKGC